MSKVKQIAFYLKEERAKQLKEHYKKIAGAGKVVSVSAIVREVVEEYLEELNELKTGCGCGVCEDKKTKKQPVSSEVAAAFGYNKEYKAPSKPKVIKNKKTQPTTKTTPSIHSITPPKPAKSS